MKRKRMIGVIAISVGVIVLLIGAFIISSFVLDSNYTNQILECQKIADNGSKISFCGDLVKLRNGVYSTCLVPKIYGGLIGENKTKLSGCTDIYSSLVMRNCRLLSGRLKTGLTILGINDSYKVSNVKECNMLENYYVAVGPKRPVNISNKGSA